MSPQEPKDLIARLFGKKGFMLAASSLTRSEMLITTEVPTMATDGQKLYINPDFFDRHDEAENNFVLAHEGRHNLMLHPYQMADLMTRHFLYADERKRARVAEVFNRAADYEVNTLESIPRRPDVRMPEGGLFDSKYTGKSALGIFWELWAAEKDKPDGAAGGGDDGGGDDGAAGSVLPADCGEQEGDSKDERLEKIESATSQELNKVAQMVNHAEKMGEDGTGMAVRIRELLMPKIDYREILWRFMEDRCRRDYTYKRPNRRMSAFCPFVIPSLDGVTLGRFVFIGDTSESMMPYVQEAASEAHAFLQEINGDRDDLLGLTCLWTDTDVYRQDLQPGDMPEPVGGGCTNFRAAMQYLKDHLDEINPAAVIFFTDGEVYHWGEDPGVPVLFIAKGQSFDPPYGEVALILP